METDVVWLHLTIFWQSKNNATGQNEKKKMEEEVDRRIGGKTVLNSGHEWTSPA